MKTIHMTLSRSFYSAAWRAAETVNNQGGDISISAGREHGAPMERKTFTITGDGSSISMFETIMRFKKRNRFTRDPCQD